MKYRKEVTTMDTLQSFRLMIVGVVLTFFFIAPLSALASADTAASESNSYIQTTDAVGSQSTNNLARWGWWLVPVLLLPVLYYVISTNQGAKRIPEPRLPSGYIMGMKGGEAGRSRVPHRHEVNA